MKKAFSMVELLVVIGIIAILAAFLVPALSGSSASAKATKCMANMHQVALGIQSYAMESGYFPLAGSVAKYKSIDHNAGTKAMHGWIGWSTDNPSGSYISPYSNDDRARFYSLTNGTIWKAVSKSREIFVCPLHRERTREKLGGADKYGPCWSYVMNAKFGWMSQGKPMLSSYYGTYFSALKNKSKTLLIAELPFVENDLQTPSFNQGASKDNDPILQYSDCKGGGNEIIGFNHLSGKRDYYAHVGFADGHVEKFRLPRGGNESNLQKLTKWLCDPDCEKQNGKVRSFDIVLEGDNYQQVM